MSCSPHPTKGSRFAEVARLGRRLFCFGILTTCALVFVHALVFERFHVPSGSMAPALYGHHRTCVCPRCGQTVAVGRTNADVNGKGEPRHYRKAFCSNCGLYPLPLAGVSETPGDRIAVNKLTYWTRSPSRWDVIVFRLFGVYYIKRLLGLPGEEVLIHDGDVYVNGQLLRKSYAEARALRVPVFDQEHVPAQGWEMRWERFSLADGANGENLTRLADPHQTRTTGNTGTIQHSQRYDSNEAQHLRKNKGLNSRQSRIQGISPCPPCSPWLAFSLRQGSARTVEILDGRISPCVLTYRHFSLESRKCEALVDEYAYNGGLHANSECVHDFSIETEIEVTVGQGSLALRLCDGHDWVEVLLPVGESHAVEAFAWPIAQAEQMRKLAETDKPAMLRVGQRYRVELAFVDRRLSVVVDGEDWLSVDLPEAKDRQGVERPFQAQADGVRAVLHRFRLHRDVHYGQQGTNAVHGKSVRLGVDQYFMMGDNSPNSEDSRYWPSEGRVPGASFVGPAAPLNLPR